MRVKGVLVAFILLLALNVVSAQNITWYSSDYKQKIPITISHSGTEDISDYYQINVTLDGVNYTLTGLLFTDADNETLFPFWNESALNTNTKVWVNVTGITNATDKVIWAYVNESDVLLANPDTTFDFFDDASSETGVYSDGRLYLTYDIRGSSFRYQWNPEAYYDSLSNRTYFTWIDKYGNIVIAYYNHTTGETSKVYLVATKSDYPADIEHANPVVFVNNTGHVHVLYGDHDKAAGLQHRYTAVPGDLTSFVYGSVPITYSTYPNVAVASDNTVWLAIRHYEDTATSTKGLRVMNSTDGGHTWNPSVLIYNSSGDQWYPNDIVLGSESPVQSVHIITSRRVGYGDFDGLYYAWRDVDGIWKYANGTAMDLPVDDVTGDLVDDGYIVVASLALNSSNVPYIAYLKSTASGNVTYFAKWNGTAWEIHEVCNIASYKEESVVIDVIDDSTIDIYTIRGTSTLNGGDVVRYRSTDGGVTWSLVENITTDATSTYRYYYIKKVYNYTSELKIMYLYGYEATDGGDNVQIKSYPTQVNLKNPYNKSKWELDIGFWLEYDNNKVKVAQLGDENLTAAYAFSRKILPQSIAIYYSKYADVLSTSTSHTHDISLYHKFIDSDNYIANRFAQPTGETSKYDELRKEVGGSITTLSSELWDGAAHNYEFYFSNGYAEFYKDQSLAWNGTLDSIFNTESRLGFVTYFDVFAEFDYIYARKYTSPEPVATVGTPHYGGSKIGKNVTNLIGTNGLIDYGTTYPSEFLDMYITPTVDIIKAYDADYDASTNTWTVTVHSDISQVVNFNISTGLANQEFNIYRNGSLIATVTTTSDGWLNWTYTGGFSTWVFTFEPVAEEEEEVKEDWITVTPTSISVEVAKGSTKTEQIKIKNNMDIPITVTLGLSGINEDEVYVTYPKQVYLNYYQTKEVRIKFRGLKEGTYEGTLFVCANGCYRIPVTVKVGHIPPIVIPTPKPVIPGFEAVAAAAAVTAAVMLKMRRRR